jgi:hypothetical protein
MIISLGRWLGRIEEMRQMFSVAISDMDGLLVDSERAIMNAWITVGYPRAGKGIGTDRSRPIVLKKSRFRCGDGFCARRFSTVNVNEDASLNGAIAPLLVMQQ